MPDAGHETSTSRGKAAPDCGSTRCRDVRQLASLSPVVVKRCCSTTKPVVPSRSVDLKNSPSPEWIRLRISILPSGSGNGPSCRSSGRKFTSPRSSGIQSARIGSNRRAEDCAYWSCRQKSITGGWWRRIQSQNRSSLLPISSSLPVTDVWARKRNRRGGSQATCADRRGTPGTTNTACGAM